MNDKTKMEELLSAYLDRELSFDERKQLDEKIKSSPELQKKLLELEQIKNLTSSSYKRLDENPYFETRLNVNLNSTNPRFRFNKWMPALSFVFLTLVVMLVLKFNPNVVNNLLANQKTNIEKFYTSNLRPVLASVGLSNEDVFNFAFNKQLPLDNSKNQYLQVYSDQKGNNYVEIKTKPIPENYDLDKFVNALNLNQKQRGQMDSILDSYADRLKSQVLVNEKNNTLAINTNLWNYHRAILADIMAFAQNANQKAFNQIVPAAYQVLTNPSVVRMINEVKTKPDSQFIFLTPDSIFSKPLKINMSKFKNEMKNMDSKLKENLENLSKNYKNLRIKINMDSTFVKLNNDSSWSKNFKVYVDTNSYRVQIPSFAIPNNMQLPNFDSLTAGIENAFKNFSWNNGKNPKTYSRSFKYKYEKGDTTLLKNFRMNFPSLDSLMKLNKINKDSVIIYGFDGNGHKIHLNLDSLMMYHLPFYSDSMFYHNQKEFEKQMQDLKKEMENFREEMKSFQKDLKTPNDSIPPPFRGKKTLQI
jgi:hypothetical protein